MVGLLCHRAETISRSIRRRTLIMQRVSCPVCKTKPLPLPAAGALEEGNISLRGTACVEFFVSSLSLRKPCHTGFCPNLGESKANPQLANIFDGCAGLCLQATPQHGGRAEGPSKPANELQQHGDTERVHTSVCVCVSVCVYRELYIYI